MSENVENIIELNNISKSFPGVKALEDVTLHIKKGEIHAFVGKNGAGKSTLIKILGGIYRADSGEILIEGKKENISSPHDLSLLGIHFVYQESNLIPYLSAAENLYLGNEPKALLPGFTSGNNMKKTAKEIFEKLNVASLDVNKPAFQLTSSERQMVTIARLLLFKKSKVIVFDEPTASLSYKEINILFDFIRGLKKSGVSIIYVSHRLEEIFQIADSVTVIRDGRKIGTFAVSELNQAQLAEKIVGAKSTLIKYESDKTIEFDGIKKEKKKVLMTVEGLKVGSKVKGASFKISEGEVVALVGLVGSGKTELAEGIFGYRKKAGGKISINGKNVSIRYPIDALKYGINLVPEDRLNKSIMLDFSVRENLTISCLNKLSVLGVIKRKNEVNLVNKIIEDLSISCASREQMVRFLSGGNQQKVVVGRRIQIMPKLFIFDEISNGIDIETKGYLVKLVRKFADEKNVSSIYITTDTSEALAVSDRILIMKDGLIAKELLTKDLSHEELLTQILTGNFS